MDTLANVAAAFETEKSSTSNAIIVFNDSANTNKLAVSNKDNADTDGTKNPSHSRQQSDTDQYTEP